MDRAGAILVTLAAFCWGLAGGLGGVLISRGWEPFLVSFYRGLIGLVFVLAWLALRRGNNELHKPQLWFYSAIAGIGVAGNFVFYFTSVTHGSVAIAVTLMYCAPVFVYLASYALKLEAFNPFKLIAIFMVVIGIGLLTRIHDLGNSAVTPLGAGAGILAGLSYAVFIFGFKFATPYGSPQTILAIAFTVLTLVLVWPTDTDQILAVPGTSDLSLFLAFGLVGGGISFVLYVIGLNYTAPAVASMIATIEPITASLFGITFLQETLAATQLLGMAVILATITALGVHEKSESSATRKTAQALQQHPRRLDPAYCHNSSSRASRPH